jgi:hypothetical protein
MYKPIKKQEDCKGIINFLETDIVVYVVLTMSLTKHLNLNNVIYHIFISQLLYNIDVIVSINH